MKRFKNYVWMAAGFAVLTAVVSGIVAAPAVAALVKAALVKNVDEPGRLPYTSLVAGFNFACTLNCTPAPFGDSFALLPPVPSGKRLIVNHIYGGTTFSTLKSIRVASKPLGLGDFEVDKLFIPGPFNLIDATTWFNAQPFLTFEPSSNVWVKVDLTSCINCNGFIRVSGYLIDASN